MTKMLCNDCKHYLGGMTCKAFPNGIPEYISVGDNDHSKVEPGQKDEYTFQKK